MERGPVVVSGSFLGESGVLGSQLVLRISGKLWNPSSFRCRAPLTSVPTTPRLAGTSECGWARKRSLCVRHQVRMGSQWSRVGPAPV